MDRNEAIKLIDDRMCFGRGKWSKHHVPEIDDYWKAGQMAIKALEGKDIDVPTKSALDHIHNVVRDDAYRRGYEQGKKDVPDMNVGDMISRQAVIDAICEDGTWLERQGCTEITMAERKQRDVDIIENLPTVQPTQEIIHCKDCKYYGRADKRRFYRGSDCLNNRIATIIPDRDFCSRAEKRGEAK